MSDFLIAALLSTLCVLLLARFGRLAFVSAETAPGMRRGIALFLFWAILLVAVFHPTVASTHGDVVDVPEVPFPLLFLGHALLSAFLLLWWNLSDRPALRSFLSLQPPQGEDWRLGLRFGALAWVLGIAASTAVGIFSSGGSDGGVVPEIPPVMAWLGALPLAQKLVTIAVAMTVEEAFFRGFLQPRIGWLPSSVLFALGHAGYGIPRLVASVFVVSLVLGQALRRTGRLLPCIVAHGVFDAIQLLVIIPLALRLLG